MKSAIQLPTFLPGRFVIEPGRVSDYAELERFHYLPKRPRTWACVCVVRYVCAGERRRRRSVVDPQKPGRIVGIGVLSYPFACLAARERVFGLVGASFERKVRFANANVRTISRVVIHPQFRALGLATALVRRLCDLCPTRYVEASAAMGKVHPLFEKAGMTRYDAGDGEGPAYFLLDRRR